MQRILIAEDEPRIVAFIEKGLRRSGFETVSTNNGNDAVRLAQSGDFDLLLLDLGLPGQDGWEVLSKIRAQGNQLLVIIVTARDGISDRLESHQKGANDYIMKPFNFGELLTKIKAYLSDRHH